MVSACQLKRRADFLPEMTFGRMGKRCKWFRALFEQRLKNITLAPGESLRQEVAINCLDMQNGYSYTRPTPVDIDDEKKAGSGNRQIDSIHFSLINSAKEERK